MQNLPHISMTFHGILRFLVFRIIMVQSVLTCYFYGLIARWWKVNTENMHSRHWTFQYTINNFSNAIYILTPLFNAVRITQSHTILWNSSSKLPICVSDHKLSIFVLHFILLVCPLLCSFSLIDCVICAD